MNVILTAVGCPLCESLNVIERENGTIVCRCLECGFEFNEYADAEE